MKKLLLLISISIFVLVLCLVVWFILPAFIPLPSPPTEETQPNWSTDGQRLVYVCYREGETIGASWISIMLEPDYAPDKPWAQYTADAADICLMDIDGQNYRHLVKTPGGDWYPVWSPDGTKIAYLRRDGIYVIDADGSNRRRLVSLSDQYRNRIAWSSDGKRLLFSARGNIYIVDVRDGILTNLTPKSRSHESDPYWALNDTKIFFLSTTSPFSPGGHLNNNASHQIKMINPDGSGEQEIYKNLFYPFFTVLPDGEIIFISDLTSKTRQEYRPIYGKTYKMEIDSSKPTVIPLLNSRIPLSQLLLDSVSPNGKYIVYKDYTWQKIQILNTETGEILEPLTNIPFDILEDDTFSSRLTQDFSSWPQDKQLTSWSYDSRQVAITTYLRRSGYHERHILIFNPQADTVQPLLQSWTR